MLNNAPEEPNLDNYSSEQKKRFDEIIACNKRRAFDEANALIQALPASWATLFKNYKDDLAALSELKQRKLRTTIAPQFIVASAKTSNSNLTSSSASDTQEKSSKSNKPQ